MAERELLLSPTDNGDAVALSPKLYRKRILPKATIGYKGRRITFDERYLTDLANAFQDGAYDQVAFMLAPDNNAHTLDPERFRGEVKSVEVAEDGLYGVFAVTRKAAEVLEQNPRLGVSARILENYQRSDGKHFPRALQHVLGTLDPVIPGLGSWEEVALSNEIPEGMYSVIDLSASDYEEIGTPMADRAEKSKLVAEAAGLSVEDVEFLDLSDDELAAFATAFGLVLDNAAPESADADDADELLEEPGEDAEVPDLDTTFWNESDESEDDDESEDVGELSDEELTAALDSLSDEELEALTASLDDVYEAEDPEVPDDAPEGSTEPSEAVEPTDAELAEMLDDGAYTAGLGDTTPGDPDSSMFTDEELAAFFSTAAAKDTAAAAAAADPEETPEPQQEADQVDGLDELVGAGAGRNLALSNSADPEVLALANQVNDLQVQLAEQNYRSLRAEYVRKGVPAALVELARPVLTAGPAATLDLSNTSDGPRTVDAAAIVRQLLDQATGYIDLARERGHGYSLAGDDRQQSEEEQDKALASLWGQTYDH